MPSLPPDRNIYTEGQNTLNAQLGLANQQLGGYDYYSGAYGGANLANLSNVTLGQIDAQAFLQQHPEFLEGWENEIAKGGDPNRWLSQAIGNASYIDPATIPRAGGATGLNAQLTGAANQQTTASNTALRAGNLADAQQFGAQQQAVTRGMNSELYGNLNAIDARNGQPMAASAAEQQAGMMASGDQRFGQFSAGQASMINPNQLGNVRNVTAMGARQDPFLGGVMQRASAGPSAIQSQLEREAQQQLSQGGQLSAQEARNVLNPIAAKYASRGLGQSNGVLADQVLAMDAATRARRQENQSFAAGVDQQGYNQSLGLGQLGLGGSGAVQQYAGQNLSAQQANQYGDLSQRGQNLTAYQSNQQTQLNNARLQQDAFLANLQSQGQQFGQLANVNSMGTARSDQDYRYQALGLQGRLATYQDPFSGMAVNSPNIGTNSALMGMGGGIYGQGSNIPGASFDPWNDYGQDLYNTNYNAKYNSAINSSNNKSATKGAIIGAIGGVAGAFIGGPIGAAAGQWIGNKIGGGGGGGGPTIDTSGLQGNYSQRGYSINY